MKVNDVLREKGSTVHSVEQDETVLTAVGLFNKNRVGALIVTAGDEDISGIVSERDVMHLLNDSGGSLGDAKVADIMTPEDKMVVTTPTDSLDYAMSVMTQNRIRHLPVVEEGDLVGILSVGDLVKNLLSSKSQENKMLAEYITGTYPG